MGKWSLYRTVLVVVMASSSFIARADAAPVEVQAIVEGGRPVDAITLAGRTRDATFLLLNTTDRRIDVGLSLFPSTPGTCKLVAPGTIHVRLAPGTNPVPVNMVLSPDSKSCAGVVSITTAGAPAIAKTLTYDSFKLDQTIWVLPLVLAGLVVALAWAASLFGGVTTGHDSPPFASFTGLTSAAGSGALFTLFAPPDAAGGILKGVVLFALPIVLAPLVLRVRTAIGATNVLGEFGAKVWYQITAVAALFGALGQVFILHFVLREVGLDQAVGANVANAFSWIVPAVSGAVIAMLAFGDVRRGCLGDALDAGTVHSVTPAAIGLAGGPSARRQVRWFVV